MKVISETPLVYLLNVISETTFSVPDEGYFKNDIQRT
jgi:hypothetical protein